VLGANHDDVKVDETTTPATRSLSSGLWTARAWQPDSEAEIRRAAALSAGRGHCVYCAHSLGPRKSDSPRPRTFNVHTQHNLADLGALSGWGRLVLLRLAPNLKKLGALL
jgi:hypothetical protein